MTTKVDGLCDDNNTIYEYMGCYWHGHDPKYCKSKTKYIANDINKTSKKTYGQLYRETMTRISQLKELKYNVIVMWECNYLLSVKKHNKKSTDDDSDFFELDNLLYGR